MQCSGRRIITKRPKSEPRISSHSWSRRLHLRSSEAHSRSRQPSNQREAGTPPPKSPSQALLMIVSPGSNLPNNFRHRRRPPRRSVSLTLLPPSLKPIHLLLVPNMGQSQPDFRQCPAAHKALPLFLPQNKGPRLRRHALDDRKRTRR